ncbi:MAG TPA: ArsR family transcriptional regulator [Chloroflexi bacterium]|nr:MAG: transcriptional regulator [Chloroflexota bacterium]HDD55717.1 ArsR family transcriptional regulator [Chloroflexota bacterium]
MRPIEISEAQEQAEFCGILGNPHRIQIIWVLGNRELTVSGIAEEIGSSMQNTSQHLRLMKNKGVLQSRRDGREIYYRIANTKFIRNCPVISNNR